MYIVKLSQPIAPEAIPIVADTAAKALRTDPANVKLILTDPDGHLSEPLPKEQAEEAADVLSQAGLQVEIIEVPEDSSGPPTLIPWLDGEGVDVSGGTDEDEGDVEIDLSVDPDVEEHDLGEETLIDADEPKKGRGGLWGLLAALAILGVIAAVWLLPRLNTAPVTDAANSAGAAVADAADDTADAAGAATTTVADTAADAADAVADTANDAADAAADAAATTVDAVAIGADAAVDTAGDAADAVADAASDAADAAGDAVSDAANDAADATVTAVDTTVDAAADAADSAADAVSDLSNRAFEAISSATEADVQALLDEGLDLDSVNPDGQTLLMQGAAANGDPAVMGTLIDAGANVNAQSDAGKTALMYAVESSSNPQVVLTLLDAGANPSVRDNSNQLAVDYLATNPSLQDLLDKAQAASPEAFTLELNTSNLPYRFTSAAADRVDLQAAPCPVGADAAACFAVGELSFEEFRLLWDLSAEWPERFVPTSTWTAGENGVYERAYALDGSAYTVRFDPENVISVTY